MSALKMFLFVLFMDQQRVKRQKNLGAIAVLVEGAVLLVANLVGVENAVIPTEAAVQPAATSNMTGEFSQSCLFLNLKYVALQSRCFG